MSKRVRCINPGSNQRLIRGAIYTVRREHKAGPGYDAMYQFEEFPLDSFYCYRFEDVEEGAPAKRKRVKCIDAVGSNLVKDHVYEILQERRRDEDGVLLYILVDGIGRGWLATRFVPASDDPAADIEDRLRAALTTTSDPYICKKCGAPKATCTYH